MKKYVYDFDQEFLLKIYNDKDRLTTDDILILHYILDMLVSETCEHIIKDEDTYVWINRTKLLNDLPILNISEHQISIILKKLEGLKLIKRIKVTKRTAGSKSFIAITKLTLSLLEPEYLNKIKMQLENFRRYKKVTSDNNIISNTNNNILDTIDIYSNNKIINNIRSYKKVTSNSDNKYKECVLEIDKYTSDPLMKERLIEYLKVRLAKKDKPFTSSAFGKQLLTLDKIPGNKIDIINQSINRKWAKFVELQTGYKTNNDKFCENNVSSEAYTKEEREKIERWQKENNVESF